MDRNHFPALPVIEVTGVAPLAGSVDRNWTIRSASSSTSVAPLAGSVDRNRERDVLHFRLFVAPLAGSVDRNVQDALVRCKVLRRSPRGERG